MSDHEEASFYILGCTKEELAALWIDQFGVLLSDEECDSYHEKMQEELEALGPDDESESPGPYSKRYDASWFIQHQVDVGDPRGDDSDPDFILVRFAFMSEAVQAALESRGASYVLVASGSNTVADWSKVCVFDGSMRTFDLMVAGEIEWHLNDQSGPFEWGPAPDPIRSAWDTQVTTLGEVGARIAKTFDLDAFFARPGEHA